MSKIFFGIDLGTSNSSISYVSINPRTIQSFYIEPAAIKFNSHSGASIFQHWQRFPSVVYFEQKQGENKIITGFQAEEAALSRRAKPFENLFMSVKSDIGTSKIYEDSSHPEIFTPLEITAEIIKALIKAAEKDIGISPISSNVVISIPASFSHSQREDTIKAARLAGLSIDDGSLIDEPLAAYIHTACHQKLDAQLDMRTPKNILIFDLGAGTCDISIFEASYDTALLPSGIGLGIKNRAISNYEKLGGDNIDLHIVEEELLPIFCEKNLINFYSLPERVKRALRFSLKIKARQLKESICRQIAQEGFTKSIEQSWTIDPLSVASINTRKTSGCMGFERFMKLMAPFVTGDIAASFKVSDDYFTESFLSPVYNALQKADLGAEDIDAFIFNGGSCHNPIIRKNLQESEIFPKAKFFDTPDLDLSVSKGAAIHCYYLHKYGKPIVTPIVNSEIGIFTYGQKREPLVKAGTELPFPLEDGFSIYDNFFIPKDNLDSVGISIYSKDKYTRILSNLKLLLPEGTRKGEPVTIGVKINSNKIMSFSAFMKNAPEVKIETELSHPWTHNVHTPEDISANELWQKVADLKKQKNAVEHETMIELADKERKRGNIWGSLEILQRLQDKDINTYSLNNRLALCYDAIGEKNKALGYFKKAMELDPQNVVLITNYGCQLVDCKRIQEGISMLRQAVDMNSEYYASYSWLGRAYRAAGEEEQAKKEFTKARQILRDLTSQHPQNEDYLCSLKSVSTSLGDYEDADMANKQLQDVRSTKMLNGSPDKLLAGPESGVWKEADFLYEEENP